MIVAGALGHLEPAMHPSHALHDDERDWPETNCYVDLWIELLHALGLDPVAACAFTLSSGFDGEQWEFFKYPLEDLRTLYGIEVHEMNLWRGVEEHIATHLSLGRYLTIEADSWYLPDTAGVAYRQAHQKSSITPIMIDRDEQRMRYFHNRGLHELRGDDYVGALRLAAPADSLPPYAELIVLDRMEQPDDAVLRARVDSLVREHLLRRPTSNPVTRLAARVEADLGLLVSEGPEFFHGYAFGSLRQCGAWAEVTATFLRWLDPVDLAEAIEALTSLSAAAKAGQFQLARAARGRTTDLGATFGEMAAAWTTAYRNVLDVRPV